MIELDAAGARAYLALPVSGNGHGVLLLHAWWGLNDTIKQMCEGLASEGFVALAPDLYDGGEPVTTVEEAERRASELDRARADRIVVGAIDRLAAEATGKSAVIAFSLGAAFAHVAARRQHGHVAAVVLFYGTGPTDGSEAPVLGHFVAGDPWEPDEEVAAMEEALRAAGRKVEFHRYEGVSHWFAEPDRPEFDAPAAQLAWQRTLEFLRRELIE